MKHLFRNLILTSVVLLCCGLSGRAVEPVDYVNPYMGNISHLLKPTYPTIHLPNGMLRVYPQRGDHTESYIHGLPVWVVNHRENHCFNLSACVGDGTALSSVIRTDYDNEVVKPYYYKVDIDNQQVTAEFAPSARSAIYRLQYSGDKSAYLLLNAGNGELEIEGNTIKGYQNTWGWVRVYIYLETDKNPTESGALKNGKIQTSKMTVSGDNACAVFRFDAGAVVNARYGISLISVEQARRNLYNEIPEPDFAKVKKSAREVWNKELGKIKIKGGDYNDRVVFYTSLYRCYERPVNISEEGRYFSASDHKVHDDGGVPFYTDDWLWDTFRATHPLRLLIDADVEQAMLTSLIRMAEQSDKQWFPTFPSITGDSRRMNCNHGVATLIDAWAKGVRGFDLEKGYEYARKAIEEKTLAPWSARDAGYLNEFYTRHGYIPALAPGEQETSPEVDGWEKRQAVAVTLGTAYDQWCLSRIAEALGKDDEAEYYLRCSYNYRNLFNAETAFFHPKDKEGKFIEPFDYRFSGGIGARDYYDENNGWTYRWDVQHNIGDLVNLMGSRENFVRNLDATFSEWLGRNKYEFYAQLPDQTGNVGQFSMSNEPSLHIPYLYNYAGAPWKTQKRVRDLVHQWFRNDLMGVPGDEDGGGLSSFVVFSMMGFYPVTPGLPAYNIGSPFFEEITISLTNGKKVRIIARNCSDENKYIQSAKINGENWNKPWFSHTDIADGAVIELQMGSKRNTVWGIAPEAVPPSAAPYPKN
ncbi:MAG: GH92 family glycosyl hydrolase [Coprobacter sp.]|nr:GH92 family glycosyl hydrolase [Coprobacter sp.]